MKPLSTRSRRIAPTGFALALAVLPLTAAEYELPGAVDWPCEQVLVPEVAAAVVWAGPPVDGLDPPWRSDPGVVALVARLTAPGIDQAAAEVAVEAFAQASAPGEKDARLTRLFAGVHETLNQDRGRLIDGIIRYSRDQQRRAEILGERLAEMVALEQQESADARAQLAQLRSELEMEQRLFDDRERAIPFLCTRPVAVEERLGMLARTIAGLLD